MSAVDIFSTTRSQVQLFPQELFCRDFPKTESSNHEWLVEKPVAIWVAVWVAVFPKNRRNRMFLNDSNN
jgi:hypothetical protein